MSTTDQVTRAAGEAVQALSTLVVAAATPVLADQVALVRADLFNEMRLHFGIVDQQAAILNKQRQTIATLSARLDQTQLALANMQIDLGIERTLGRFRDDQIRELQEAHNTIVADAEERLEQLRGQLDDRDRAMTEAEARIADLESRAFPSAVISNGTGQIEISSSGVRISSQEEASRIASKTKAFWLNTSGNAELNFDANTPLAQAQEFNVRWTPQQSTTPADRCPASWSSAGRHCGCKICCWCKQQREA